MYTGLITYCDFFFFYDLPSFVFVLVLNREPSTLRLDFVSPGSSPSEEVAGPVTWKQTITNFQIDQDNQVEN